jgi:hypothetical protein
MSGKKFMVWFAVSIVITSIGIVAWMKQGYDTRPNIEQQQKQEALQAQPAVQMENSPADTEQTTK